jgi:predicted Zn finger-like uncharacterized protein
MIAACPKCQTRYRVEPGKLGAEGARLRCSQCSAVFRVRLPAAQAPAVVTARTEPVTEAAGIGRALASDAAALGGVARSEPQASEVHRAAQSPSNQPRSAEGRGAEDLGSQSKELSEPPDAAPQFDHARLVLLAHPNPDTCKRVAEALERQGLQVLVAHDGVEAILTVQRALPRAVVLDAALPKMFGFQVCELIKRNESLRVMHVCLIGAIHREDRYRRAPNEFYGADHYIESPSLPGALIDWLGSVGFDLGSKAAAPAPTPSPLEAPRSQVTSGAKDLASDATVLGGVARSEPKSAEPSEAPASGVRAARSEPQASEVHRAAQSPSNQPRSAEGRSAPIQHKPALEAPAAPSQPQAIGRIGVPADPLAAERAQAERLARIIVSDIVLYNEEKFSAAVRNGGVLESMRDELAEGRTLFRERIDVQVRDERDYLADELMRVARSRGAS